VKSYSYSSSESQKPVILNPREDQHSFQPPYSKCSWLFQWSTS
jgi:hypothetical protein